MKKIIDFLKYRILGFLFITCLACNEEEFLKEIPLDFFSPENSYVTKADFESAITELYSRVRYCAYQSHGASGSYPYLTSTDIAHDGRYQLSSSARFGGHSVFLVPTNTKYVATHWNSWYKLVSNANTIISRLENADIPEGDKKKIAAEAKFMRAFGYRYLVYLYGGVPLNLEEVTSPKKDYTRATKEEVLNQIIKDASEAAEVLPGIDEVVDGRVSSLVAQHLLAETYISLQKYENAIQAASIVINDPNTSLMTERFGSMANQDPHDKYLKFTRPGDVYWDLFRKNNQNRSSGNKESLWVIQFEEDIVGGILSSTGSWSAKNSQRDESANVLERIAGPVAWMTFVDPDGEEGTIQSPQSNYNSGGQGVSLMKNTEWFLNDLWESDWNNDIRNAPHNIVRDFVYNNPNSAWYDSSAVKYPSSTWINQIWRWYPYPSKITTPGQHPDDLFKDKEELTLKSTAGSTFRDNYMFRLAETYLLRAEAYLGKDDLINAAKDINVVRERSKATPVSPEDVTLDYILDERARELVYEEPRRITLHRTGKLVERVRKYNLLNKDEIQDYHGLWPIPFAFIEANTDAVINQNPGY
ncbi:RagB/SusD family nutrient uptake outer membrane protein [Mariniphaga sediminis]|uniref:RagB/SusD family nutrient uptake outer membrane protein n=1 Tax=Mariniphaga sediminis TaxID=1628158 RepID=UPI003561B31A